MFVSQKKYDELYDKWRKEFYRNTDLANELARLEKKHKELREAYELVIKGEFEAAVALAEKKKAANYFMRNEAISAGLYRQTCQYNSFFEMGRNLNANR